MNDQSSDQQCKFHGAWCTHCFVWSRGALTVKRQRCGPKTGGVLKGCKISLSAMQTPIRQERPTVRIPYFRPLQMPPMHSAARGACPSSPPFPSPLLTKYLITIKIIKFLMIVYSNSLNAWAFECSGVRGHILQLVYSYLQITSRPGATLRNGSTDVRSKYDQRSFASHTCIYTLVG